MERQAQSLVLVGMLLLSSCQRGGQTPLEQKPLQELMQAYEGPIYLTLAEAPGSTKTLVQVLHEFRRHPLEVAIVWQTAEAPSSEELARFPGKGFRQYHDPRRLTPTTSGLLRVYEQGVALEPLPLRVALARATLRR